MTTELRDNPKIRRADYDAVLEDTTVVGGA